MKSLLAAILHNHNDLFEKSIYFEKKLKINKNMMAKTTFVLISITLKKSTKTLIIY